MATIRVIHMASADAERDATVRWTKTGWSVQFRDTDTIVHELNYRSMRTALRLAKAWVR